MNYDNYLLIIKGLLTGIVVGYLLIYGLRPAVQYPDFILDFFENKWIFLILLLCIYYVIIWDLRLGLLLLLGTIALIFDYIIFTKQETLNKKNDEDMNNNFPKFI